VIVAAVDVNQLADEVAGIVGGEEDDDVRDVLRLGSAAGRATAIGPIHSVCSGRSTSITS
jgi:hypothetical protein